MHDTPPNDPVLAPGDTVFCLKGPQPVIKGLDNEVMKSKSDSDGLSGPVLGRVYRVEHVGPGAVIDLENLGTTGAQANSLAGLPAFWFRKATAEEITTERRQQAWETDQLMLTAMKQALDSGQPLTGDLRHWWVNRY